RHPERLISGHSEEASAAEETGFSSFPARQRGATPQLRHASEELRDPRDLQRMRLVGSSSLRAQSRELDPTSRIRWRSRGSRSSSEAWRSCGVAPLWRAGKELNPVSSAAEASSE